MKTLSPLCLLLLITSVAKAHEGHSHAATPETKTKIIRLNTEPQEQRFVVFNNVAQATTPKLATLFDPFSKTVKVRFDRDYLFVESNGLPAHGMMTGITAWQQQVPLPHSYTGDNAWRIPLHPVPASNPMSTKSNFFRGAIALAVNGVPIFNPIKNDGRTDTLLAGELDQWGGHCGRADDYHYHIAPVHLEKIVGAGNPVAVALDGYPIYGYNDPNGKPPTDLDWLNGHKGPDGAYHYHATKTFPYLNGGFYGEVSVRNGQVDPQPRAHPMRPSRPPLRGAKITGFENPKANNYILLYDLNGEKRSINYTIADNGSATFNYVSPQGTTTETNTRQQRGGGGDRGRGGQQGQAGPPRNNGQGQGPARDRQRGGGQRQGGGGDPIFQAIDSNGNGILEKSEIQNTAKAILSLDKNNDGEVTREELRGPRGRGADGRGADGRGADGRDSRGRGADLVSADERGSRGRGADLASADERGSGALGSGRRGPGVRPDGGRPDGSGGRANGGRQGNGRAAQASGQRGTQSGDSPHRPWIVAHADEIDRNQDKAISLDELLAETEIAFATFDANSDGSLSSSELRSGDRSRSVMGGYLARHSAEIDRDGDGTLTRAETVSNSEHMFAALDTNADGKISVQEKKASRRKYRQRRFVRFP